MIDDAINLLKRLAGLDRKTKRALIYSIDVFLIVVATWIAFALRVGSSQILGGPLVFTIACSIALWFPAALFTSIYRAIVRFSGTGMLMALARAAVIYAVPMALIFMLIRVPGVPRTVGLLQPLVLLTVLVMSRIFGRYLLVDLLGQRTLSSIQRNVIIYGAGSAGQQLALSMRFEPGLTLVGFVDDDPTKVGRIMDGVPIYHPSRLGSLIEQKKVSNLLLAMPQLSRSERNVILSGLQPYPIHVMTLPNVRQFIGREVSFDDLRDVKVEDLLGREPVPPNPVLMDRTITGKTVMVTGAGGSIGSELCRQIIELHPAKLILVERSEYSLYAIESELSQLAEGGAIEVVPVLGDVNARIFVDRILASGRPQTVFHAAAYKHVPLVEANRIQGIQNNVDSTANIALAAGEAGVDHCILISTDKAVRPTNVMGATKRICELVLQALAARKPHTVYSMVRFGNVLGSSGSVVPRFEAQIRAGGPVTLTHRDITRYFMTIPEAAQLVIQAGAMAKGGEVFVLDMGECVRIYDLARSMIHLSGLSVRDVDNPRGDIEIKEVGLRPGEKLYEELLIGDNPMPTEHERIMQAQEVFVPWETLQQQLANLSQRCITGDAEGAMEIVRQLVPGYKPPQGH